jgi:hypothetical protein
MSSVLYRAFKGIIQGDSKYWTWVGFLLVIILVDLAHISARPIKA